MPRSLTSYRVFIASPRGLGEERKTFRDVIERYNEQEAVPRGVHFVAEGWETRTGGVGRPQRLINETVEQCDYFVLLLHDRWGTPPAEPGTPEYNGYTSGTEEEYNVAMECYGSDEHDMRDMLCLFKAVNPAQISDPGAELQRVLAFKKEIERHQYYKEFDRIEGFRDELRAKLAEWLRHHESGDEGDVTPPVAPPPRDSAPDARYSSTAGARDTEDLIDQARRLADDGKRLEAEALFARAIARGDEFGAFIAYGEFLFRVGRLAQAEAMYERSLELADLSESDVMRAVAYGNLGVVLQTRGDLDGAEAVHRKALEISERLGRQEGMASQYGNLGVVLQTRGDLDGAEAMYRRSLEVNERLGRQEGMASQYGNLGVVLQTRGDLDGAEAMYRRSLEISERLGRQEGMAIQYGNLGNVLQTRGDLDGAEAMYRKALEISERLGRQEGIAFQYGNLGNVLQTRGDLDGARDLWRRSHDLFERIGAVPMSERVAGWLDGLDEGEAASDE